MAVWDLSEIQSGKVIHSAHMRQASSDWQGSVEANNNDLLGVAQLGVTVVNFPTSAAPSTPASGHIVVYLDTSDSKLKFKNSAGTVTRLDVAVLDDLTDVTIDTPVSGNVLTYDSLTSQWINGAPPSGVLPSQTGKTGSLLFTDGTDTFWSDVLKFDISDSKLRIVGTDTAPSSQIGNFVLMGDGGTGNKRLGFGYNVTAGYAWIQATNNGTGYTPLVLNGAGSRVLIGTTTDDGSSRVQVDGTVKATTLVGAFDAEASGSTLTVPFVHAFVAAKVQDGVALSTFSTPPTGAPTPVSVQGTNTIYGTLSFADTGTQYVMDRFRLPSDWTGAIDAVITWRCAATSGDVVWQIATAGVADGATGDPSFNTANTVTDTAKGTTLQWNTCTISNLTLTGLAAGSEFFFKVLRDPAHASDTLGAAAELVSVSLKLRRAI